MRCLFTFNEMFSLSLQKVGNIAGVNYLKMKNDVTRWKVIVSDKSQIQATSDFFLSSSLILILPPNNLLDTTAPGCKEWRKEQFKGA